MKKLRRLIRKAPWVAKALRRVRASLSPRDVVGEVHALVAAAKRVRLGRALIVVIAPAHGDVEKWVSRFAPNEVRVLRSGATSPHTDEPFHGSPEMEALREALTAMPVIDCVIDARGAARRGQVDLWRWAYYYVRAGGVYAIAEAAAPRSPRHRDAGQDLETWVSAAHGVRPGLTDDDVANLRRTTSEYAIEPGVTWFRRRLALDIVVTERDADRVLPLRFRKTEHRVLRTLPGETFTSSTVVDHHSPSQPPRRTETVNEVPPLTLREYRGSIGFHGHMAFSAEGTVLPSSFRYPWGGASHLSLPHQPFSVENNLAYRLRSLANTPWLPDAPYVDLTHPFHGHFGHLIAQTVARLWALDDIADQFPEARFLLPEPTTSIGRDTRPYEMLYAAGVPRDRVTWVSRPVRMRHLIVPSLGLQYSPTIFVHPAVVQTWSLLRERLVQTDPSSPSRIFVSRRYGEKKRGCRNAAEVDAIFEEHGFTVVYPEDHSLEGQAKLFGNARVIAGFGGSGMYNAIFADHLDAMIILNSESYSGRTEHLIATRKADRLDYFWNPPLVREGADYKSPWEFDFPRHGSALRELLASL